MGNYIGQQRLSYLWDKMKATFAKKTDIPTNVSAFTNDAGYLTDESGITIYSGTGTPSSSLGANGDIYIKTT